MDIRKFVQNILSIPAPIIAGVSSLIGVVLCVLSVAVDLHQVERPSGQMVGYIPAINWSFGFSVLFPLVIFFFFSAFQCLPPIFKRLEYLQMISNTRKKRWVLSNANAFQKEWQKLLSPAIKIAFTLSMVVIIGSMAEFVFNSAIPLINGNITSMAESNQADWDVGSLLKGKVDYASRAGNILFTFLAYSIQGLEGAVIISFVVYLIAFSTLIYKNTTGPKHISILPSMRSKNNKCGYEVFQNLLDNSLYGLLASFLLFYCSRLQNIYLRTDYNTFYEFLTKDLLWGVSFASARKAGKLSIEDFQMLLTTSEGDFSSVISVFGICTLLFAIGFLLVFLLRNSAKNSRDLFNDYLLSIENDPVELTDLSNKECLAKLSEMKFWPIDYVTPNRLLILFFFSVLTLIFYKIGLIIFGIILSAIIQHSIKMFLKMRKDMING